MIHNYRNIVLLSGIAFLFMGIGCINESGRDDNAEESNLPPYLQGCYSDSSFCTILSLKEDSLVIYRFEGELVCNTLSNRESYLRCHSIKSAICFINDENKRIFLKRNGDDYVAYSLPSEDGFPENVDIIYHTSFIALHEEHGLDCLRE